MYESVLVDEIPMEEETIAHEEPRSFWTRLGRFLIGIEEPTERALSKFGPGKRWW